MSLSIRAIIRALVAPEHQIRCSPYLWESCITELNSRGVGIRESGAFLLGTRENNIAKIQKIVYYNDLDPHCLDKGIIILNGAYYNELWKICRESCLEVLADVHTHPFQPIQSEVDRKNPMIGTVGHIAIIVPNYATRQVPTEQLGVYEYLGNHDWKRYLGKNAARFFYVGRWY